MSADSDRVTDDQQAGDREWLDRAASAAWLGARLLREGILTLFALATAAWLLLMGLHMWKVSVIVLLLFGITLVIVTMTTLRYRIGG